MEQCSHETLLPPSSLPHLAADWLALRGCAGYDKLPRQPHLLSGWIPLPLHSFLPPTGVTSVLHPWHAEVAQGTHLHEN